jgi:4-carboxymuconolactone decarboxylase
MTDRYEQGLAVRRAVLGADYVDAAITDADSFSELIQNLTTEYCWGLVWTRPGLDRRVRSLINLAMLTALNQPHELKLHIKGAINNGATKEDVAEVLLQAAVYCGVPAGMASFRVAAEAFSELGL